MLPNKTFNIFIFVIKYNYSTLLQFAVEINECPTVASVIERARSLLPERNFEQLFTRDMQPINTDDSYLGYTDTLIYLPVRTSMQEIMAEE